MNVIKNVLFISVRADFGGGPMHVDLLINGLKGITNLYVACPDDKPYFAKWKTSSKVREIIKIPHRKFTFTSLLNLKSFCIQNNINIVHSHGKGAGVYSRFLKLLLPDIKIVHTFHGLHIQEYSPIKKKAYLLFEKYLNLLTDRFINVSFGEQKLCIDNKVLNLNKSKVIYNGISPLKENFNARLSLNFPEKFVVVTISRFDYPKNMSLAYKIVVSLKDFPEIAFLWVGNGDEKKELEERAQKEGLTNIMFVGFKENVSDFLSSSDIYLSTSRWEGLPFALIEALSLGKPLIATDVVGNNEVVLDGQNGFLFNQNNPEHAKELILKIYHDKLLLSNLSEAARKDFKNRFLKEEMVSQVELLYNEIT